jgi:hypothetical protein
LELLQAVHPGREFPSRDDAGIVEAASLVVVLNDVAAERVGLDELGRPERCTGLARRQSSDVGPEVARELLEHATTVQRRTGALGAGDCASRETGSAAATGAGAGNQGQ